jgi:hypothetical protein
MIGSLGRKFLSGGLDPPRIMPETPFSPWGGLAFFGTLLGFLFKAAPAIAAIDQAKNVRSSEKRKRAALADADNASAGAYRDNLRKNASRSSQETATTGGGGGTFDAALKSLTGQ